MYFFLQCFYLHTRMNHQIKHFDMSGQSWTAIYLRQPDMYTGAWGQDSLQLPTFAPAFSIFSSFIFYVWNGGWGWILWRGISSPSTWICTRENTNFSCCEKLLEMTHFIKNTDAVEQQCSLISTWWWHFIIWSKNWGHILKMSFLIPRLRSQSQKNPSVQEKKQIFP